MCSSPHSRQLKLFEALPNRAAGADLSDLLTWHVQIKS